jgi:diguanylate cyclase (GGDEF)-like protein
VFVIIMRHISDRDELDAVVTQRMIPSIRQSAVVEGHTIAVSCSVGVALYPDDAIDQDELMRRADAAMYEAKAGGRDTARFFQPKPIGVFWEPRRSCAGTMRYLAPSRLLTSFH